jgi:2-polyprenyl-6-methoxyphenol hydroxylase-like FAD-dependent oxidoreductase
VVCHHYKKSILKALRSVIHRADYLDVLEKAVRQAGVDFRLNAEVAHVEFDTPSVRLANGEDVKGDVVVAADGKILR